MDADTEAKIVSLRHQGLSYRAISGLVGYSTATICQTLKKIKPPYVRDPVFGASLGPQAKFGCVICHAYLSGFNPYPICKDPRCCSIWIEALLDASYEPVDKENFGPWGVSTLTVVHKEPNGALYLFPDTLSHILYHAGRGKPIQIKKPGSAEVSTPEK